MIRVIIASDVRGEGSSTIANQIYFSLREKGFNVNIQSRTKEHSQQLMSEELNIKPDKREVVIFDTINGYDIYNKEDK